MTIRLELARAEMLARGALFCGSNALWAECIATWRNIAQRTKWVRLRKVADREIARANDYLARDKANERYCLELRAKRSEDRQGWEARGYRVFNVVDSYCFSTQPSPMYCAESWARRIIETLDGLGISGVIQESPDYEYHSVRCPYWGSSYSNPTGHVVVLVPADTPMDLEVIRRKYAAHMRQYWLDLHVKHGWDMENFESMYGTEHFMEWR